MKATIADTIALTTTLHITLNATSFQSSFSIVIFTLHQNFKERILVYNKIVRTLIAFKADCFFIFYPTSICIHIIIYYICTHFVTVAIRNTFAIV